MELNRLADSYLNKFKFHDFLDLDSNKRAIKIAEQFVSHFGNGFGSLIVYGPAGTGKTHLVGAICNELALKKPSFNIVVGNSESNFNCDLNSVDVLVIDDADLLIENSEFSQVIEFCRSNHVRLILVADENPMENVISSGILREFCAEFTVLEITAPSSSDRLRFAKHLNKTDHQFVLSDSAVLRIAHGWDSQRAIESNFFKHQLAQELNCHFSR